MGRKRGAARRTLTGALLALVSLVAAGGADAREVTFPLELEYELLRQSLLTQVFTDPDETARVWNDGSGCNELVLAHPTVRDGDRENTVRIESRGRAAGGVPLLTWCFFSFEWDGFVEVLEEPELTPGKAIVRFRVVDSNLYGREHEKQLSTGVVWDWVKEYVHPRLAELRIDLAAPLREVAEIVPLFLPRASAEQARRMLESVHLRDVTVTEGGLRLGIRFEIDDVASPASAAPADASPTPADAAEPPLTEAEIQSFVAALQQVDAFVTFVVKVSGNEAPVGELRAALLEVLLEERYDLVAALAEPRRDAQDPVREIFLASWERLTPVLRRVAPTLPAPLALRYLSFVSAGDALRALDEIGPASGIEVSADGLRRLARIIAPATTVDPLEYGTDVDADLRAVFGFGSPLPQPLPAPADDNAAETLPAPASTGSEVGTPAPTPTATAASAPAASPAGGDPQSRREPETAVERLVAAIGLALSALIDVARAETDPGSDGKPAGDGSPRPAKITAESVTRLNRWTPRREDLDEYLPLVRDLLQEVAGERARADGLDPEVARLFRSLVPATAWQESCWRQFVLQSGKRVPLRSPIGAVGIMQINQSVWRGFYDVGGLQRDMQYNARAGTEILSQYLRRYVIGGKRAHASDDDVARAAYAIYNGGPGQLRRLDRGATSKREQAVYASFRAKLAKIRAGDALAVRECFAG